MILRQLQLVLISAALVFVMTPGLAFFYGGLGASQKCSFYYDAKLYLVGNRYNDLGFWWIQPGIRKDIGGIIGDLRYFALNGVGFDPMNGQLIPALAFFVYQEMFAIITPALITGAFADRVNFKSYLVFLVFWSVLIYIPLVHWIWGGGFLAKVRCG